MSTEQNQERSQEAGYTISIPGKLLDRRLTIKGRLPGLNEYTDACRTNPRTGAKMKQDAQELVMWHILSQIRGLRFTKPVFLLFTFYERDRRRDRDNVSSFARKVIQDALVKCSNLQDDGWDYVTGHYDKFAVDKKDPRIVVEFIEQEAVVKCSTRQSKKSKK
jgi:hypothetical protein